MALRVRMVTSKPRAASKRREAAELDGVAQALFVHQHEAFALAQRAVPARIGQGRECRLADFLAVFVIGKAGLPVAAQQLEQAAAEIALVELRLERDRLVVGRHRLVEARRRRQAAGGVEMAEVLEHVAAVDVRFRDIRAANDRLVETRQRFVVAAELLQQRAAVEPVRRRTPD